jgi:hypothetical protein
MTQKTTVANRGLSLTLLIAHAILVLRETAIGKSFPLALNPIFATYVVVFVVEEPLDDFSGLVVASQSNLDFWDNPIDDEVWNKCSVL